MTELHRAILEIDLFTWLVERVVGQHLEKCIVPAGPPNIVYIVKPYTSLRDRERIVRWFNNTIQNPRLKIVDGCLGEEYIVAPPRYNGVTAHTAVSVLLEE